MSGSEIAKPVPQVNEWMKYLGASIDKLQALAGELETRLGNVLRNLEDEEEVEEVKNETACLVPLVQILYEYNIAIARLDNQLGSVLRRLEV